MGTNKAFVAGSALITVGGTLLGMVPLKEEIREHLVDLPDTLFNICLATGVLCCTAGLLFILAGMASEIKFNSQIRAEDMVSSDTTPYAVYIGGIAARGKTAQAFAYGVVAERLTKYLQKGVPLYTRPVSADGRRLVKKWGFTPVGKPNAEDPSKVVWRLRQPAASLIKPKILRGRAKRVSAKHSPAA
jgi:hypothetical protein